MRLIILCAAIALAGCSTLTNGTTQTITIDPKPAPCLVMQGHELVDVVRSKTEVKVKREKTDLIIDCPGYRQKLKPKATKEAIAGAALLDFGIVDLLTGAFWGYNHD